MQTNSRLKELASTIMVELLPQAMAQKTFFINDIDPAIQVNADNAMLEIALRDVLQKVIDHAQHDCIRVSATLCDSIIVLCMKQKGQSLGTTIAFSMESLQPVAEKLGGNITVVSGNNNSVTIAFSFYNGERAA